MTGIFNRGLLAGTLFADGLFSLVSAIGLIAFAKPIADIAGPAISPFMLGTLGTGLLVWGIFHLVIGRYENPPEAAVYVSMAGDLLWIIASLIILALGHGALSMAGIALVTIAMIGVADFLFFKLKGYSRRKTALA